MSTIELKIPDIRTIARARISEVNSRIPYKSANFLQITGTIKLSMKDLYNCVNEGIVKPHKADEGREGFTKMQVAIILARKDLKKHSFNKQMKKELNDIFEEETQKLEEELKKKN